MAFPFSRTQLPTQLFINNEYVSSNNNKTLTVHNPKDGSLVSDSVPCAGEADVEAAVTAAEAAFPAWKRILPSTRRDMLLKFASLIEEHAEALGELNRITLGVPYEALGKFENHMCAEVLPATLHKSVENRLADTLLTDAPVLRRLDR